MQSRLQTPKSFEACLVMGCVNMVRILKLLTLPKVYLYYLISQRLKMNGKLLQPLYHPSVKNKSSETFNSRHFTIRQLK